MFTQLLIRFFLYTCENKGEGIYEYRRTTFFWLTSCFVLALTACGGGGDDSQGDFALKINDDRNGLVWDAVEDAMAYEIDEDGAKSLASKTTYSFSSDAGSQVVLLLLT